MKCLASTHIYFIWVAQSYLFYQRKQSFLVRNLFYNDIFLDVLFKRLDGNRRMSRCLPNTSTFVPNDRSQCLYCVLPIMRGAFGAHLDVGLPEKPTPCRFVEISRFLPCFLGKMAVFDKTELLLALLLLLSLSLSLARSLARSPSSSLPCARLLARSLPPSLPLPLSPPLLSVSSSNTLLPFHLISSDSLSSDSPSLPGSLTLFSLLLLLSPPSLARYFTLLLLSLARLLTCSLAPSLSRSLAPSLPRSLVSSSLLPRFLLLARSLVPSFFLPTTPIACVLPPLKNHSAKMRGSRT